jgi:hypothetical protein
MTVARILYTLVCAGLLLHAWMAYSLTGILPGYAGSYYWFTIPHLLLLPLSTAMVALDALLRKRWTFMHPTRFKIFHYPADKGDSYNPAVESCWESS